MTDRKPQAEEKPDKRHIQEASQMAIVVKNLLVNAGDMLDAGSPGREDPLEEGMAIHSSILAWRTPRTEETGGLRATASQTVRHDRSNLACSHTL